MGRKLFPPIIETKLPAFTDNLFIPLTMNKTVSKASVKAISVVIKSAQSGKILYTFNNGGLEYNDITGKYTASFGVVNTDTLIIGQFYKVQIAYINYDDEIGYYSNAGIIKKTTLPELSILGMEDNLMNRYDYTGQYKQVSTDAVKKDESEKIYSYKFNLTDYNGIIIDSSGEKLHKTETDTQENISIDSWRSTVELEKNIPYTLTYEITTVNGLKHSTSTTIVAAESVDIDLDIDIKSELDYDNGIIKLYMTTESDNNITVTGDFILTRSSHQDNFSSWNEVYKFSYVNVDISKNNSVLIWEDYSVCHGEEYLYALQASNSYKLLSNKLLAKNGSIMADFEDCYLSDASKQLRICFNPKISSFKINVLESKVNTLGSKYPFIFKNGYVHYKEFPISGLISLISDTDNRFYNGYQSNINARSTTPAGLSANIHNFYNSLNSNNIKDERKFKMEVLEWLNNGEAKIFRSPTEGNYIVRIMNSSLSPNDTLGRMLHTFSCTACEIADWSFNNLISENLIKFPENKRSVLRIGQVRPAEVDELFLQKYHSFKLHDYLEFPNCYSVNITDATPGSIFGLYFSDQPLTPIPIEIGGTGSYYIQTAIDPSSSGICFKGIKLISGEWGSAKITFEYYDDNPFSAFSNICDIQITDEIRRFVGPGYEKNLVDAQDNILSDIRRNIGTFHFIKLEKRYIQEMWQKDKQNKIYARNEALTDIIETNEWNPLVIYHDNDENIYYNGSLDNPMVGTPDFRVCLNRIEENYSDFGGREGPNNYSASYGNTFGKIDALRNVDDVQILRAGNGILVDVAYRVKIKVYGVEEDIEVAPYKQAWLDAKDDLQKLLAGQIANVELTENNIQALTKAVNDSYSQYINALSLALENQKGVKTNE